MISFKFFLPWRSDYLLVDEYLTSLAATKHVFGVSDQFRHKAGCAEIDDGQRLENSDFEFMKITSIYAANNKGTDQSELQRS